ncbi:MAG: zf-HC2 domain-containing protein [Planctomycetia bacterium]|nr:zf-HC2 domain-containing protein [Planctomycetia bacterium]
MSDRDGTTVPDMQAQLNAYLDGEVDGEERTRIEQALADDTRMQHDFQRLQRAWDLLDVLPRADVGTGFTQMTVEMIALDAKQQLAAVQKVVPRRTWIDRLLIAGGVATAGVAGFFLVDALRTRPDDTMLRDLPVLERLDLYGLTEPGENAEFFRQLRDRRVLAEPAPSNAPAVKRK